MRAKTNTQPRILAELSIKPEMTEQELAIRLHSTQHGIRCALNTLMTKGKVKRRKRDDSWGFMWRLSA